MRNPRLNLRLTLMLNMDTMDIPLPMDTMLDIILVLTDTDIFERDPLMLNLNPNTTIIDTTMITDTIGDTMVDSLDTTIIEIPSGSNHSIFINLA